MVSPTPLWQNSRMTEHPRIRHYWTFCVAALGLWVAYGWPVAGAYWREEPIRGGEVSPLFFAPFAVMGLAVLAAMMLRLRPAVQWALIGVQLAAVVAMTLIVSWAGIASFLVIIAFQVGLMTGPRMALGWVAFQNLAVIAALAQALNPDLCWVLTKSTALQFLFVFTAQALQREAATSQALAQTNRELRSAQAVIANSVRSAERLRISRELHDSLGHELTALGLQLEIAGNVGNPERAQDHVRQARGVSKALLAKVRETVATMREAERWDLEAALRTLADSVPAPRIHVEVSPQAQPGPEQTHALVRCAQEAITNAIRHAHAANLWLRVVPDGDGVRLVARDDGRAAAAEAVPGSGLTGMRERVELLGGRLTAGPGAEPGFTVDAWLPSVAPSPA